MSTATPHTGNGTDNRAGIPAAANGERRQAEIANARLAAIMHFSGVALIGVAPDGRIDSWNRAAERLFGYTADEIIGQPVSLLSPADRREQPADIARRVRAGATITNLETVRLAKDGRRIDVLLTPAPILDIDGTFAGTSATLIDITERKAAEATNARLAAVLQSAGVALGGVNQHGIVESWNPAAERLFGYSAGEIIGQPVTILIPPDRLHEFDDFQRRLRAGEPIGGVETVRLAKDGRAIDVQITPAPILGPDGSFKGLSVTLLDITERKKAEETQRLLIDEINHRVKNTLNVLQAIAQQTLQSARTPAHFVDSFSGRVQALARAHSLLTRATWAGADLATLVREQVVLDCGRNEDGDRVSCSGPVVMLERQAAVHMALVLHELGTNARKYGALSVADGRLSVSWRLNGNAAAPALELSWRESGGPTVSQHPEPGFGTKLIERSLAHAHGGDVRLCFEPEGLRCDIQLPLPSRPGGTAAARPGA